MLVVHEEFNGMIYNDISIKNWNSIEDMSRMRVI
jgi:hypothetical protein